MPAGLAHFLEHAVHLGSAKYPDEKDYKLYLSQHGGSSNASTSKTSPPHHTPDFPPTYTLAWAGGRSGGSLLPLVLCITKRRLRVLPARLTTSWVGLDGPLIRIDRRLLLPTGMTHTQYHCKVHHAALPGALDRLGQFFSAPLLAPDAVAREVEAVHAEFSRK